MILYKGRPQTDADAACHVDPPSACGSRTSTVLSTHQELELLDDEANVYKLVGPALIKQDLVEAKSNVSKRVEYIKNEMYVPCPWVPGSENGEFPFILTDEVHWPLFVTGTGLRTP